MLGPGSEPSQSTINGDSDGHIAENACSEFQTYRGNYLNARLYLQRCRITTIRVTSLRERLIYEYHVTVALILPLTYLVVCPAFRE
jgi:hypothetical protein